MGKLSYKNQVQNKTTDQKKERNASAAQKSRERTKVTHAEQQAQIDRLKNIIQNNLTPFFNQLPAETSAYVKQQLNFKVDIDVSHPHLKLKRPAVKRGNRQTKYQYYKDSVKQEQPSAYPSRANTPMEKFSSPNSPGSDSSSGISTHSEFQHQYTPKPTRSGRNALVQPSYTAQTPAIVNQVELQHETYPVGQEVYYYQMENTNDQQLPNQSQIPVCSEKNLAGNAHVQYLHNEPVIYGYTNIIADGQAYQGMIVDEHKHAHVEPVYQ